MRVDAVPASRLLRNRGDRIEVRGSELEIGLSGGAESGPAGLATLDGFREVDVELVRFRTGPFAVSAFVLTRSSGGTYAMAAEARISSADLARLGAARLRALPGGGLLEAAAPAASLASRDISVSIEVALSSEATGLRVLSGGGTIAGYPAGPIASAIAATVARRLEIAP